MKLLKDNFSYFYILLESKQKEQFLFQIQFELINSNTMKKLALLLFGLLIYGAISSQVLIETTSKKSKENPEYTSINNLNKEYIRVYTIDKIFGNKFTAEVDYGQNRSKKVRAMVLDKDNKVRKFNSVTEIINLFSENGWEYVTYTSEVLTFKKKE